MSSSICEADRESILTVDCCISGGAYQTEAKRGATKRNQHSGREARKDNELIGASPCAVYARRLGWRSRGQMKTAMRNTLLLFGVELSAFSPPLPKTSLTYLITIWPKRNESQAMIRHNALRRSGRRP